MTDIVANGWFRRTPIIEKYTEESGFDPVEDYNQKEWFYDSKRNEYRNR